MSCGCGPKSKFSPEYLHPYKPENNSGCGIRSLGCDTPSLAMRESPRWKWEQTYGKLVTTFTQTYDANGHAHVIIERTPCEHETTHHRSRSECCSVQYQLVR